MGVTVKLVPDIREQRGAACVENVDRDLNSQQFDLKAKPINILTSLLSTNNRVAP